MRNFRKSYAAGVLSEDLAYNLFIENNNIAIRMLEIATKMLKRD